MKHSKTPWVLDKRGESLTSNGIPVCVWNLGLTWSARSKETEANAAFIVKACNSHYQLLESVKRLSKCMAYNAFGETIDKAAYLHAQEIIKQIEGEA